MTPSARLIGLTMPIDASDLRINWPLDLIEFSGRWDYGPVSVAKMGEAGIIDRWLAVGEESMVEMVSAAFLITCSRVVSHELVRHRLASFQQESQRFVAYDTESPDDLFYQLPPDQPIGARVLVDTANLQALGAYRRLRSEFGVSKQLARYVLPNAIRTRLVMSANLREWRHILRLRLHKSAQPEMQEVAAQILAELQRHVGRGLFPDDIAAERGAR